jgi:signal transduction histidine kinase
MAPATSRSSGKKSLAVINDNCSLRRNVAVQPFGRCSVCTLELKQCHAWQSSTMGSLLIMAILAPLFVHDWWGVRAAVAAALALLLLQTLVNHRRIDQLILAQDGLSRTSRELRAANRELEGARAGLEQEVLARTERLREANVTLARTNLELGELVEGREHMVLDLSHDLRTPLTSVKGAAQNMLDGLAGALTADQREYVEIIRDHAERLITAVGKLLETARACEVRVDLEAAPIDVGALSREVVKSLQPIADERGVRLEVLAPAARTLADGAKLRKVVENLVANALKFTERGGHVKVEVSPEPEEIRLVVEDDGVGMEPDHASRIFDRFYRARQDRPGSGLGLCIARDLVRLHGGDVHVKTAPGKGSTFAVVLPRRAAA